MHTGFSRFFQVHTDTMGVLVPDHGHVPTVPSCYPGYSVPFPGPLRLPPSSRHLRVNALNRAETFVICQHPVHTKCKYLVILMLFWIL